MKKEVEILSPAGSYESMKAAIAAGADAIYIGGSRFGARAYADNLEEDRLLEAIDYVHLHGRRIYLTVNTLLKERELQTELYEYLHPYYERGLDAVIVQDIGVLKFIREQFPDIPIHASTQMTLTNVLGAKFLEQQGVERIVTARELNLKEIKEISEQTNVEIESFVHGALCYCYSGQCLYSSMIGGRSGNRGQCAQPCRLPYQSGKVRETSYLLSLKDICTLEYIPDLIEAGIYSFKIEGRMKKPEYVALVTAMYRKYTDMYLKYGRKGFHIDAKDKEKLMDLYNRGGFHGGYYHIQNGREMLSLNRPNHAGVPALKVLCQNGKSVSAKALVDIHEGDVIEMPDWLENYTFSKTIKSGQNTTFVTHKLQKLNQGKVLNRVRNESLLREVNTELIEKKVKETINGKIFLSSSEPARLVLSYQDVTVEVTGDVAQEAVNQPMDAARIEKQMRKTGNTEFIFDTFEVVQDGKLFMPMQSLNELRRTGIERLTEQILWKYRRKSEEKRPCVSPKVSVRKERTGFYVSVETPEQFQEVLLEQSAERIYVDCNVLEKIWKNPEKETLIEQAHQSGKQIYLGMPHIFRAETRKQYEIYAEQLLQGWDGILIRNYESYAFLKEHLYSGNLVTDYNLYQFNQYAKSFWEDEGAESGTAPLELNYRELMETGVENQELIVYGYLPMMVSAQCIVKTTSGCKHQREVRMMRDRYHKTFAVKNNCDYCYNMIYNTAPLVLTDQKVEVEKLAPKALRIHFTLEDRVEVRSVLALYREVFLEGGQAREPETAFTRGHFKRGIK